MSANRIPSVRKPGQPDDQDLDPGCLEANSFFSPAKRVAPVKA